MKIYQKYFLSNHTSLSISKPLEADYSVYDTVFGQVLFVTSQDAVLALEFVVETVEKSLQHVAKRFSLSYLNPSTKTDTLWEKFQKNEDVPLLFYGTAFSIQVWRALLEIPKGELSTYQKIADEINMPQAVRAVARAIGSNPIAWLVPCHRVIRKDGNISGFFYGVDLKKRLLSFEKAKFAQKETKRKKKTF